MLEKCRVYSLGEIGDMPGSNSPDGANNETSNKIDKKIEKLKEKAKEKITKFPVVNVRPSIDSQTGEVSTYEERSKDYLTRKDLYEDEKANYKYISTYDDGKKDRPEEPKEEYVISSEHNAYQERKRRKALRLEGKSLQNLVDEDIRKRWTKSRSRLNNKQEDKTAGHLAYNTKPIKLLGYNGPFDISKGNDIIKESMDKPKQINYNKLATDKDGDKTKGQEGPNHKKIELSKEDLKLQARVYELVEEEREKLSQALSDNTQNVKREKELKDFERSPYGWIKQELLKRKKYLVKEHENPNKKDSHTKIRQAIKLIENSQYILEKAFEEKIPLKLEFDFGKINPSLNNGAVFDKGNIVKWLNAYLKEKSTSYSINGALQRGNGEYLILKTSEGKEVEIYVANFENVLDQEKERKLRLIRANAHIEITRNGKKIIYHIQKIEGDRVFYSVGKDYPSSMTLDKMRESLLNKEVSFRFVAGEKIDTLPLDKIENKEPTGTIDESSSTEKLSQIQKVKGLAEELSMPLNELVIQRYMKVGADEAKALLEEHEKSLLPKTAEVTAPATSPTPLSPDVKTEPQTVDGPVVEPQEPEPVANTEQVDAFTQELIDFIKEWNEKDQKLKQLIRERAALLAKIEQQNKQQEEEDKKNEEAMRLKIAEDMKNKQEKNVEKIRTDKLKKEIEKNMKALLDQIKDKDPEILDFKFKSNKKGFILNTTVKINKTGNIFFRTATIDLKIPLINNKSGELIVGEPEIDAGVATNAVTKLIKPNLAQFIPLIKKYFEEQYKKQIESMSYGDDNLVLTFKE